MKTVKTLIILATFLIMIATLVNIFVLREATIENKNLFAFISVGAMAVLLLAVVFLSFQQGKMRKLKAKLEQKEKDIVILEANLNEAHKEVAQKTGDVPM